MIDSSHDVDVVMVRHAAATAATWWLNGLTFVCIISFVSLNGVWAAEITDANDYAWATSVDPIEVVRR